MNEIDVSNVERCRRMNTRCCRRFVRTRLCAVSLPPSRHRLVVFLDVEVFSAVYDCNHRAM